MSAVKGNVSVIRAVSYRTDRRCSLFRGHLSNWLLLWGLLVSCTIYAAAQDDYLQAIELETEKLEGGGKAVSGPTTSRNTRKVREGSGEKSLQPGLSMEGFEQQLSDNYTGSAVFYRKLSRRSQEEIYGKYREGAVMSELRSTIMNRFLNRK
jgi:hypothetical protein